MIKSTVSILWFIACFIACSTSAVTLSISPTSVSNSFSGNVLISITGLTNRESIILEQYLDLDSDGTVAPSDPMTQRLILTDGVSAPAIAGVQNVNVPGDLDGKTNGQITVGFPFQTGMELNRIAGNFRFRLSSPTGRFSTVEKPFSVTQTSSPQSITGTVHNAEYPLSNAVVILLSPEIGFVNGTVADSLGHYSLATAPGDYQIATFKPGTALVGNRANVSVSQAETVALDLTTTATTRSISGYIRGTANAGIPGVQIVLQSSGGQMTVTVSDQTGYFNVPVTPDTWKIAPSESGLSHIGYTAMSAPVVVDTTLGNVSTNLSIPAVTSLIYGSLTCGTNVLIPGIPISASGAQFRGVGTTDSNGTYVIGVTSGFWSCQADSYLLRKAGFLGRGGIAFLNGKDASRVNLTSQPITSHLLGKTVEDNGKPVQGLTISAKSSSGFSSSVLTDSHGDFDLSLNAETWQIQADPLQLSGLSLLTPTLPPYVINDSVTNTGFCFRARNLNGAIAGRLINSNGVGIGSVSLTGSTTVDGLDYITHAICDSAGNYMMRVCNGDWEVDVGDVTTFGYQPPAFQLVNVSNSTNIVNFVAYPLPPLSLEMSDIPVGSVGTPYLFQLKATGGTPPLSWTLSSGVLPPGIQLGGGGTLSGTPASSTNATFEVVVMDLLGNRASNSFSITIFPSSLTAVARSGATAVDLQVTGEKRPYVVESAFQVSGPWTPISTNELTGIGMTVNIATTNSQMFYRTKAR